MQQKGRVVDVLVTTPLGGTGQGGIDRIMASLKHELDRHTQDDVRARFLPTRGEGHVSVSALYLAAFCAKMLSARLRGKIDVVHINLASHGSTYRKLIIAACATMLAVPYILHLHGAEYMTFWSKDDTFLNRRIRAMFQKAARVVVLGTVWRDFIISKSPETKRQVVIVPNATSAPALPWKGGGDQVHILFLGRIGKRKGVPELCEALASMKDLPGWRATIAGDGEAEQLRFRLNELGLSDKATVLGWQGPDEVANLLSRADILTLPSHAENLPMSIVEGMAAGLAVVATPVGAVEDIVSDGETGILVSPGDVAALKNALARLVADPDLRRRMGDAGRSRHREYLDVETFTASLCEIWRTVARDRMEK
ncbi:glycosyltransferase family 4 protein (plasmid) [Rhizobium sp. 32-5/1]|uniref:glycosyltransferase family 4 protein n=1 Tax=Rhizobium sp. 32-5/1 TaxID=3019602 RepID=UPI00240E95ED|nr:glycosyltransferase family 4 protein [Rhizobium sp. 32-5/1]WEZ85871.1 glycosyltransferase family 4 protein [Rhizobium sp. 32-5/1]